MRKSIVLAGLFSGVVFGQTSPVVAKVRPPAPSSQAVKRPTTKKEASELVDGIQQKMASIDPELAKGSPELKPKDVPLTQTALEAVKASEDWRSEHITPVSSADGKVLYNFGANLPTVVCAPLHLCMVDLQAGEKIAGDPVLGDSVRWSIAPAVYGAGDGATPVIVLKPLATGLDTNLIVTTDRRAYYLRLVSKQEQYVSRTGFTYPAEENSSRWQAASSQKAADHPADQPAAVLAVEKVNFGYAVHGGDVHLRPVRVYDDGQKTFIQMPADISNREAPALVVLGADGKGEMTNYRVKGQTYIVDRLFDRARLVLGSGKHAQKVEIVRENRG